MTQNWAGSSPPHLDKIQKNSSFFFENVPKAQQWLQFGGTDTDPSQTH